MPKSIQITKTNPAVNAEQTAVDDKQSLSNIAIAWPQINNIITSWGDIDNAVDNQRADREQRVDIEAMQESGEIGAGETYIGVRTIDNNITKSIPPHISYIVQPNRMSVFRCNGRVKPPADIIQEIETEYTRVTQYEGWVIDWIRLIDGAEFLGWCWSEVLYDQKKPGHAANNFVATADLIFDLSVKDIQESRFVLKRYKPTLVSFLELATKHGFDEKCVKDIKEKLRSENVRSSEAGTDSGGVTVYQIYYKEGGNVYCAWLLAEFKDKWLRAPKLFWNGIKIQEEKTVVDPTTGVPSIQQTWVEQPETQYPFFPIVKRITENERITRTQGRGELDAYVQEAACTLWTGLANTCIQSTKQLWCPKTPDPTRVGGVAPKQTDVVIKNNALWDSPMENFTSSPPDPSLPNALDRLDMQNADNISQPAWTVNNRQDSRKTAAEVRSAEQQNTLITSTQVVVLAYCKERIDNAMWRIVQSQALQGRIVFLPVGEGVNNNAVIALDWHLLPAGTTDVVERREVETRMQMDWPIYSQTPLAIPFLQEYTRLRYPKFADAWVKMLQQGDPVKQALANMINLVQELATDETGKLQPAVAPMEAQLKQALMQAQQLLAPQPQPQQQGGQNDTGGETGSEIMG